MELLNRHGAAGAGGSPGSPSTSPAGESRCRRSTPSLELPPTWFAPRRRFDAAAPEWLDRPDLDEALLREELLQLEHFNQRLGGVLLVVDAVSRMVRERGLTQVSILDLGTGRADVPRALVAWGRSHGVRVTVTGVDVNPGVLRAAREACPERDWPEIRFEQQNMLALPHAAGSHDLVLCSLALHHFATADAVVILRRIGEIARVGWLVNDLRRNWLSVLLVEIASRLFVRGPKFAEDARQSIRSAFSLAEFREMTRQAGLEGRGSRIFRRHLVFRMTLEGLKEPTP